MALALMTLVALGACSPAVTLDGQRMPRPQGAQHTHVAPDTRLSGWHFMSRATQALQDDDTQNPAFLWVQEGQRRFEAQCASCHAESGRGEGPALRDVATRYPAFDTAAAKPFTLAQRIRHCHSQRVSSASSSLDDEALLALESHLAHAARGLPIAPPSDPRLAPWLEQGRQLWQQRLGQIDLSCSDCHDRLAGRRLGGSTIPQAHPTGYPVYRLEWQGLGNLQRRLRGCLVGVRAEPFAPDAPEWVALELYLKQRAAGMITDAPAVRP